LTDAEMLSYLAWRQLGMGIDKLIPVVPVAQWVGMWDSSRS
jgi:hypothetical protein